MAKLTLSVEPEVVRRAKSYARRRGTSVSGLVERFLRVVSEGPGEKSVPPVLRRVRGSLKGADSTSYRRYLEKKYR